MSSDDLNFETLKLCVRTAQAAKGLLDSRLESATPDLENANSSIAKADQLFQSASNKSSDPASRDQDLADANEAARSAFTSAREAMSKLFQPGQPIEEWKECRSTIDRFDKILVDLRKTGFGFVTALVSAAAFLFN